MFDMFLRSMSILIVYERSLCVYVFVNFVVYESMGSMFYGLCFWFMGLLFSMVYDSVNYMIYVSLVLNPGKGKVLKFCLLFDTNESAHDS